MDFNTIAACDHHPMQPFSQTGDPMATTLARVKKITAEILKSNPKKITDTARFVQDLGAESIQSVELVAALEEEFGVEINENQATKIKTVDGAAVFIDKLLAKK
jgi:acyl carrier protein